MTKKIEFGYYLYGPDEKPEENLSFDRVIDLTTRLKEAYQNVKEKYEDKIECKVDQRGSITYFTAKLKENEIGFLEPAFRDFISIAGMPHMFYDKKLNKEIVKKVLGESGKTLKRTISFFGLITL